MLATLLILLSISSTSLAQQEGILPGEPDPNQEKTLLDDRQKCPAGQKRFQKMKCGGEKDTPVCQHYSPVLECRKKAKVPRCKGGTKPVPEYRCEPS
jgi:hypothetical protein